MNKFIDPHLHLFNLEQGDYHWLEASNPPFWPNKQLINRDFGENDLVIKSHSELAGFVHVEAGFDNDKPERELAWLEQHCTKPFKSIAFANICSADFHSQIQTLLQYTSFIGIRHILDEQAETILTHPKTLANLKLLESLDLIFELQCDCSNLAIVKQLSTHLSVLPNLTIIINHCGTTSENILNEQLHSGLTALAKHKRCFIKCSGWEMRDNNWQIEILAPLVSSVITIFSEHRVMLASNFPVCLFSFSYSQLWQHYTQLDGFSSQTLEALCFSNAAKVYKLFT
ncbi:amidohydrolase family protein [Thalassotalea psychrophila]|uniref:Amidohydrolase family protein n=1 Tax=Thalassotalea psychrophila TaxID=3065647 RepID=A0ABY9TW31_9GAMM|nr:amidohydrolase family protein [Colwelliaceae bacterium SQ149]